MSSTALFAYAAAVVVAVATPGPAMIALIGRGLARGHRAAMVMAFGIAIGDVLLASLAMLGLAALMALYSWLLTAVKFAGAAYLIWLGIRMWRTPPAIEGTPIRGRYDLIAGLALALGNPKAILFHASLLPLVLDLGNFDWQAGATILLIIFAGNLVVMNGYAILAGAGAKRLSSASAPTWLARIGGGTMIGTGAVIAIR